MTSDAVTARLEALLCLKAPELRQQWRKLYGSAAPRLISKDLLLRAIAHRIQEQAFGELGKVQQKRIQALSAAFAGGAESPGVITPSHPGPGSRLVREWRGHTYIVCVLDSGYEFQDTRYASLTEIVKRITGTHRSGPQFFGLRTESKRRQALESAHG